MMTPRSTFVVSAFLVPPWAMLMLTCWWVFIDDRAPMDIVYQHPKFTSKAVDNRADARNWEISEAPSGDWVWLYRELCVHEQKLGTSQGSWISGAFVWQTPEHTLPVMDLGCYGRSFNIRAPTSNPTRDFVYRTTWSWRNNPVVNSYVTMPEVPLRVLAPSTQPSKMSDGR